MAPGLAAGPVTRVCHVCGRQYGLSSFEIHLKQCKKLWVQQEEQKPVKERRPIPKTPPGLDGAGGGGMTRAEIEAINQAAQEAFNVHGMEKCENCGRTFAEGRLAIHLKSCRPDSTAKKVGDGAAPRNKPEPAVDYGRARNTDPTTGSPMPPRKVEARQAESASSGPPLSSESARPLAGSIASNRKRITAKEGGASGSSRPPTRSSADEASIDPSELRDRLEGKADVIQAIEAKLERWEATTVATLQEIRDLKEIFAQLK